MWSGVEEEFILVEWFVVRRKRTDHSGINYDVDVPTESATMPVHKPQRAMSCLRYTRPSLVIKGLKHLVPRAVQVSMSLAESNEHPKYDSSNPVQYGIIRQSKMSTLTGIPK